MRARRSGKPPAPPLPFAWVDELVNVSRRHRDKENRQNCISFCRYGFPDRQDALRLDTAGSSLPDGLRRRIDVHWGAAQWRTSCGISAGERDRVDRLAVESVMTVRSPERCHVAMRGCAADGENGLSGSPSSLARPRTRKPAVGWTPNCSRSDEKATAIPVREHLLAPATVLDLFTGSTRCGGESAECSGGTSALSDRSDTVSVVFPQPIAVEQSRARSPRSISSAAWTTSAGPGTA